MSFWMTQVSENNSESDSGRETLGKILGKTQVKVRYPGHVFLSKSRTPLFQNAAHRPVSNVAITIHRFLH